MFTVGTLVAGKYRIDHILGRGGMGMVAAATHIVLHQRVALKFLHAEYAANKLVVERFVREARASGALRGEHVCRVSDVGALDNGTPFLVMELLEGADLARQLRASGTMPVALAASYVLQACLGVGEAHALGIIHRDLKPANLFVARRPDGTPLIKVLDFGIAKAQGAAQADFSLTQTSAVLGSPGYMSPEQLRSSRDVDLRTDVWSLGVILYELVAGRPPFTAESITELAIRVSMDPRPALTVRVPDGFDQVIDRCLAKQPADRYPDLASLAHALVPFAGPELRDARELASSVSRLLHSTPVLAPLGGPALDSSIPPTDPPSGFTLVGPNAHAAPVPTTLGSSVSSLGPERRERPAAGRRWGVVVGVAVLLVAIVVTWVVAGSRRREVAASQPPSPPAISPADAAAVADPVEPAGVPPDAMIDAMIAAATAMDAALAEPIAPSDAALAAESAPVDAAPRKKPRKPARQEDFGESRY